VLEPLLTVIIDSLSNLASSDDEEDGEDENDNEDTEVGKLSEDDEPGWVMGTISNTVRHSMDSVCQKEVTLDELMQPGWVDRADYFHRRDKKYVMAEKSVLAVVKPQTDTTAASPSPTIFGNLIETVDIILRQSSMPHWTSGPGCTQPRLVSNKPQSHNCVASLPPDAASNSSPI